MCLHCRTSLSSVVRSRWKLIFETFLKSFHRSRAVFVLQIQRERKLYQKSYFYKLLINSEIYKGKIGIFLQSTIKKEAQQISIFIIKLLLYIIML